MSRRRQAELDFGSDSFMDVIANMVGILIILIVIAGLRVRETALTPEALAKLAPPPLSIAADTPRQPRTIYRGLPPPATVTHAGPSFRSESPLQQSMQIAPLDAPRQPEPEPVVIPSTELVAQAEAIEFERRALAEQERSLEVAQSELQQQLASRNSTLTTRVDDLDHRSATAAAQRQELLSLNESLTVTKSQLKKLRANLQEASSEPEATIMEHRMTPVGRLVEGSELHFRLSEGRVTHVPIDDLAAALGTQIQRQKSILLKTNMYQGTVGPVDGYIMEYRIEKARASLEDELRMGGQMVRMNVTQWTLMPQPGLVGETADEATQRGSEFYRNLLTSGPTTTLTFWVYPDSFGLHRELQQFAVRHGYQVAARPLPTGVPIAGSPNGSKSIAQ